MRKAPTIEDLEKYSGLSIRTLHYYMQKGLLPGPDKRGKNATYSQEHLDRLDLINMLKEIHLPLDEIRTILNQLTPEEIHHYLGFQEELLSKIQAVKPEMKEENHISEGSSALQYIRGLEEAHLAKNNIAEDPVEYFNNLDNTIYQNKPFISQGKYLQDEPKEERWRRLILVDGIELHTRETIDKEMLKKIYRLRSFARSLFEPDEKRRKDHGKSSQE